MAKIPHVGGTRASFGQRGQDRPSPLNPNTSGMNAANEALAGLANTVGNIAEHQVVLQQRENARIAQENEELARAKGTNALLDYEVQVKAKNAELQARVETGDLDWRRMREEAETAYQTIEVPKIDGLAAPDAERLQGGFARTRTEALLGVGVLADKAKRVEFKAQITGIRDQLGKRASDPTADIGKLVEMEKASRPLAVSAGMGETFDKDSQTFADTAYTNNAKARFNVVRDDLAGLQQLERDLTEEGGYFYEKLDADKRNAVVSQILTRRGQLEAKAQHTIDKREAAAERAIEAYDRQIATGQTAPLDFYEEIATTVKGTAQEAAYQSRISDEVQVQSVMRLPPDQQRAFVLQLEAKQAREGATVKDQANLARLRTRVDANVKQLKEAPLSFHAQRTGADVAPLDLQALVSGDVAGVQRQFAERMVTLRAIREQYGPEAGDAPLLPAEASALAGALAKGTPRQAVQLYGVLNQAMNDPAAYRAAMQQIAPDSPVRAYAGMVFAMQRETTTDRGGIFRGAKKAASGDVAQTMLDGEALLNRTKDEKGQDGKGGAFPMPTPASFTQELDTFLGKAFAGRPGAYETAAQAVRAHYAGSAAKAGDVSGEMDAKRLRTSVRAVLGEPVDVNGTEVFPPWGMDESDFEDRLEAAWGGIATRLPDGAPTDFGRYQLRQATNESYHLVLGGQFLTGKDGRPVRLTVAP